MKESLEDRFGVYRETRTSKVEEAARELVYALTSPWSHGVQRADISEGVVRLATASAVKQLQGVGAKVCYPYEKDGIPCHARGCKASRSGGKCPFLLSEKEGKT